MKKLKIILFYILFICTPFIVSTNSFGASVGFTGKVGTVEVRPSAWGSILIITILNSSGVKIKLCDAASDPYALALSLNDTAANNIQALAISAKMYGVSVTGTGIDQTFNGLWCGIGNFAIP